MTHDGEAMRWWPRARSGGTVPWCVEARRRCRPGWAVMTVVWECQAVSVQQGVGMLQVKALAGVLTGGDDRRRPRALFSPLGASCLSYNPVVRGPLGENPVQILDERRRRR